MTAETQEYGFSITSTFAEVSDLAERAGDLCAKAGAGDLSDSLRLCLAEALNNVVEHAYCSARDRRIEVSLRLAAGGFDVSVTDSGAPMPGGELPAGQPDLDFGDLDNLPEGGFGWMLIRAEVDRLAYERRGDLNVLTMGKDANA